MKTRSTRLSKGNHGLSESLWPTRIWKLPVLVFAVAFALRLVILYLRVPIGSIPYNHQFGTYNDFYGYYVNGWLSSFQSGLVPYRDFFYQYPPLFLYGLYPLYRLGEALGTALGIILADSGSAVPIYFIAKQNTTQKNCVDCMDWIRREPFCSLVRRLRLVQPMIFFLLHSILLIGSSKLSLSAVFLDVAVLFKREVLFAVPA